MNEPAVLLVSHDPAVIRTVEGLVRGVGPLRLAVVGSLDKAFTYESWDRVALVLVEHHRSEPASGVARLFRMLSAARRPVATIILGQGLDEEAEYDLLRRGAADCLLSPFDVDRLSYLIETLTLRARRPGVTRSLAQVEEGLAVWDDSDPTVAQARRVASQDTTVLIRGEAGTGKSRLARIIHDLSPRRRGALASLRCATLSPECFEEDSFGIPDATGGDAAARKLEEAREGTLVLDDVDALSPPAQVALLRWVEDGARQSSAFRGRPNRPRIVATTRLALADCVAAGTFRSDLFFRLNVIGLELPPLRQRRVELVSIALGVLEDVAGRSVTLTPEAIAAIEAYGWPGNVRELREVLDGAVAAGAREAVGIEHLPERVRAASGRLELRREPAAADPEAATTATLAEAKREAEYHRITQALQRNGNNRLRTASELGISRMTLYKKLYKYGIIEPASAGHRRSPGRSRGTGGPPGLDEAGEPSGPEGDRARGAGHPGRGRPGRSAPALH